MKHTELTTATNSPGISNDFDDWADFNNFDAFEIKKEQVAADLANLLVHCHHNRTYVSNMTGWSKSRVTNLLSGDSNLTLKSLWEFTSCLGYTFDVVFRQECNKPNQQPWIESKKGITVDIQYSENNNSLHVIKVKTARDVAKDMLTGQHSDYYLCVERNENRAIEKGVTINAIPVKFESNKKINRSNYIWTTIKHGE